MVLSQALINAAREGDLAAVQEWLDAGGDPDDTGSFEGRSRTLLHHVILPEEEALRQADERRSDPPPAYRPDGPNDAPEGGFRESARLIRDARLLRPRIRGVFALRALCHRGRAGPTAETPEAFARLIGGGTSRPRTRAAAKTLAPPGLPDPLAHLVCKFWLGEPPKKTE